MKSPADRKVYIPSIRLKLYTYSCFQNILFIINESTGDKIYFKILLLNRPGFSIFLRLQQWRSLKRCFTDTYLLSLAFNVFAEYLLWLENYADIFLIRHYQSQSSEKKFSWRFVVVRLRKWILLENYVYL